MSEKTYRVAVLGNTKSEAWWATEQEYLDAWGRAGHLAGAHHEPWEEDWRELIALVSDGQYDIVQWTSTRSFRLSVDESLHWKLAHACKKAGVPLIGVHLDIWVGFQRQRDLDDSYFNAVDLMMTADGGNDETWAELGIEHHWLLPAISERWLGLGTPQEKYRSKIAFTGSWDGSYHKEAKHRHELVAWLDRTYGDDVVFWPKRGEDKLHGRDLNDLYASVDVVVGDSAVLPGKGRYCSDRIPEVVGRGGYLLHPTTEGINAKAGDPFYRSEAPLCDYWDLGDWNNLRVRIDDEILSGDWGTLEQRQWRVDQIAAAHTYTHRCREIIEVLTARGML